MCHQALTTCLGRLRSAIVAYAELASSMDPGPEREQVLDYAQELARQSRAMQDLCNRRCGPGRCTGKGEADA